MRSIRKTIWTAVIASVLATSTAPAVPIRAADEQPAPLETVAQLLGEIESPSLADPTLSAPALEPMPAAVAFSEVEIRGTAPLESTVRIYYRKDGAVQESGSVYVTEAVYGDIGSFETGAALWSGTGVYEFYATAEKDGLTSPASASQFVEFDETKPMEPESKGWTNPAYDQILLQWDPPYQREPNPDGSYSRDSTVDRYEVFRDGAKLGETRDLFYLDAGLPESGLFQYEIYALDRAGNRSEQALWIRAGSFHRYSAEAAAVPENAGYNQGIYSPTLSKDGTVAAFIARLYSLPGSTTSNSLYNVYTYDVLEEDPAKRYKRIGSLPQHLSDPRQYIQDGLYAMSGNGKFLAYTTRVTLVTSPDLYIYDDTTGYSDPVLPVWAVDPKHLAMSDDGEWLVFASDSNKVVEGDDNEHTDIFLYHRPTKTVKLLSRTNEGEIANDFSSSPAISGDGRYAAFLTSATNMPGWQDDAVRRLYVYDTRTNTVEHVPVPFGDDGLVSALRVSLSRDGQTIALQGVVGYRDIRVYVHDRRSGQTESIASHLGQGLNLGLGEPRISADGRYVAFSYYNRTPGSPSTQPFDSDRGSIRYDRVAGEWTHIGNRAKSVTAPFLSGDGSRAAFLTGEGEGSSIHIACFEGPCTDAEQPESQLSTVTWSHPNRIGGQLPLGASVAIQAFGTSGIEAQAVVRYGSEGEKTATLPMTEDASQTGVYRAAFVPPEGATDVLGIRAEQVGAPDVSAEADPSAFPLKIAGEATVKLTGDYAGHMRGGWVRFKSRSETLRYEGGVRLGDVPEATVPLPGPAVYAIELIDARGVTLRERAELEVKSGGRAEAALSPKPSASLAVKLTTAGGEDIRGASVRFYDAGGRLLETARWEADYGYRMRAARYVEEEIVVRFDVPAAYETPEDRRATLAPGANELAVSAALRPDGAVRGVVTDQRGQPVPGATVFLVWSGRIENKTVTDASGAYTLRGPTGDYTLRAEKKGPPSYQMMTQPVSVRIEVGSDLERILRVTDRGRGYLTVHLQYSPLDEESKRLPVDDWRQAVDYGITVTGGKDGVYADAWKGGNNRIPMEASPGDAVEVCSRGLLDDNHRVCAKVTLDDQRNATARLELTERGRIVGRVDGVTDYATLGGAVSRREGNAWRHVGSMTLQSGGTYSFRLSQAGEYRLEFTERSRTGGYKRVAREVAVEEGKIVEIPPFTMPAQAFAFFGREGNALHAKNEVSPGEIVTLRGSYRLEASQNAAEASLVLDIPAGATLEEGSVVLNGAVVSPTKQSDGRYLVPIGAVERLRPGSVTYRLKLAASFAARAEARLGMSFRLANETEPREETVGSVYLTPVSVTLEAPRLSASQNIYVSGRAPAGSQVTIFADRETVGVAEASPGGFWGATVSLPSKPESAIWRESPVYGLQAKVAAEGGTLQSETVRVSVDETHAVIESVTMQQSDGRVVTLDPSKGVSKFPYVIVPGMPLFLDAEINEADRVSNVTFWVGDTPIPATRTGQTNEFSGYLIPNHSLKTGIYVTYDVAPKPVEARMPPTAEQWSQYSRSEMTGGFADTTFARANEAETAEAFGTGAADGFFHSPAFKMTFPDGKVAYARLSLKGIEGPTSSYTNFAVAKNPAAGAVTFSSIVPTSAMTREAQLAFQAFAAEAQLAGDQINTDHVMNVMSFVSPESKLTGVLGHLNAAKGYVEDALDFTDYADQLLDFQNQVINSECHAPSVNHYIKETERIFERAHEMLVLKQITAGIGLVAGVVTGGVGGLVFATALTILGDSAKATWQQELDLLKKDFEENKKWRDDMAAAGAIDRCKEPPEDDEKDDQPKNEDKVADPVWIWDPSGYVYEAVASNRLEGVKATIFYQDPQDGSWSPWDADWYGQSNPLYTDANGKYGWDVPEGKWKVSYEKNGYLPAESVELTVLPPHFDVNIPMTSLEPPRIDELLAYVDGALLTFSKPMLVDSFGPEDVALARGGENVPGVLAAVDAAETADGRGVARTFRFQAALEVGAAYTIRVSTEPTSYASVPMEQAYEGTATATGPLTVQSPGIVSGRKELLVRWKETGVAETDRIRVYWRAVPDALYTQQQSVEVPVGARFAAISGLLPGAEYEVKIAVNPTDERSEGAIVRGATVDEPALAMDATPPAQAGSPRATNVGVDRADLVWTDPADADFRSMIVAWRKVGDAAYSQSTYVEKGVGKAEIRSLQPSTDYEATLLSADTYWNVSEEAVVRFRTAAPSGDGDGSSGNSPPPPPPPVDLVDEEEATFGPATTAWSGFGGSVVLRFPAGTFDAERKLKAGRLALESLALPKRVAGYSDAYRLEVGSMSATGQPFRLTLKYDAEAAAGIDPRKLGIYRLEGGAWRYVGGVLDSKKSTLSVELTTFGVYAVLSTEKTFADLSGHWSRGDVEALASRFVVDGFEDGSFRPEQPLTRAQFSKLLVEVLVRREDGDAEPDAVPTFVDVSVGAWHYDAIARAAALGLVQGSDGYFRPDDAVTREEMAVLIVRALGLESQAKATADQLAREGSVGAFRDGADIAGWAIGAVELARELGLMNGMGDGAFSPASASTRAQGAAMILRLMERRGDIGQ
ncbi:S-layer homology domain-containing protein [Paenibacillus sp.]|uniref:S-layer homology domain-containing protein n=1 Tax=Paenibacillus sp. TaxID=58172 RepID=UPI0028127DB9|nr:S-layer homology domain-containing protein [Paenibacillus sp.]